MIQRFVDRFIAAKPVTEESLKVAHPGNYSDLVKRVVEIVGAGGDNDYENAYPDAERITAIDHGDYQGTQLYIIGEKGYQPSTYWSIFVNYGSCSGCDTLEGIRQYDDEPPNETKVNDYYTLMLHMVQNMRLVSGESVDD